MAEAPIQQTELTTKFIDPSDVKPRPRSIRGISNGHVVDLMFAIAAVGCIHFPVVDESDTLLAGEHRLEAIKLLRKLANVPIEELKTRYAEHAKGGLTEDELMSVATGYSRHFPSGMPVHVMRTSGLDADQLRLRIEVIENEKRRDFSPEDLQGLVMRLKEAGYTSKIGKPQPDQLNLNQELERILGKSRATVYRRLKELSEQNTTAEQAPSLKANQNKANFASKTVETTVQIKESPAEAGDCSLGIKIQIDNGCATTTVTYVSTPRD
jgi:hypothetical protein